MSRPRKKAFIRPRVLLPNGEAIGPGKADLLEAIDERGSIAAAGRRLGMSYKRAWSLVERLNDSFTRPVVETSKGGTSRGGASLTATGRRVLQAYREAESIANEGAKQQLADLASLVRKS